MSGFEVVGVVLAVLPLILSGLEAYSDSSLDRILRAKQLRQEFARDLRSIFTALRFAMNRLFYRADAQLTPVQWETLDTMKTTGSHFCDIWKDMIAKNLQLLEKPTFADIDDLLGR